MNDCPRRFNSNDMKMTLKTALFMAWFLAVLPAKSDIRLAKVFGSNMVLQRDTLVFRSLNIIPTLSGAFTAQNQSLHPF